MARTLSAANLRIEHSGKFESAEDGKFRTLNSITFYDRKISYPSQESCIFYGTLLFL